MAFKQAERTQLYLRCALFGPSGSGKTMTALRIAKGIADRVGGDFAVIDTEARSASKYSDRIKFVVDDLSRKTVDDYIASMHEAARMGYKVLVIDSLSHAWRELTEEVDRIAQNSTSKNSWSAWGKVSPKQKRLIEAILNYPGHIIATMRSKTEWVIGEGKSGKLAPEKMGLAPEQGKGIEYEFDTLIEINQAHKATVTKDRTGQFQDEVIERPGEDFGSKLYDWLTSGNVEPSAAPMSDAKEEAEIKPAAPKRATKAKTPTAPSPAPKQPSSKGDPLGERCSELVQEIGKVFNAVTQDGSPYFTEAEKAEGRNIITTTRRDETGLEELGKFRDVLTREYHTRQQTREQGLKQAA